MVALANALAETRLMIAAEEARILFELNRAVEQAAPVLQEATRLMLLVDEIRAGVRWSLRRGRPAVPSWIRTGACASAAGGTPC